MENAEGELKWNSKYARGSKKPDRYWVMKMIAVFQINLLVSHFKLHQVRPFCKPG